jgi:alpha-galactosidase
MASATLCLVVLAIYGVVASPALGGLRGGVALTPYMGVDTWYAVGTQVDEDVVTGMANAMVAGGLVAAGYNILWIDGGWWNGARDSSGNIVVSPTLWPHGMTWLAGYLHARGIHAGIYTDAGVNGCVSSGAGSYGHYQADVNTFAAWGFDAIKVDFCGGSRMRLNPRAAYRAFGAAIQADSPHRPMLFNICDGNLPDKYGPGEPSYDDSAYGAYAFDPGVASSWRTSGDIGGPGSVDFARVLLNLDWDAIRPFAAGPGHWNDPDYLVPDEGMTPAEAQAQFSMWAILAAPLVLSDDVRTMPPLTREMVTNQEAIAIDQDRLGIQGWLVARAGDIDVWARPLANGDRAVALLNRGSAPASASISVAALGLGSGPRFRARDVWAHTTKTVTAVIRRMVPADSAFLLRVSPMGAPSRRRSAGS